MRSDVCYLLLRNGTPHDSVTSPGSHLQRTLPCATLLQTEQTRSSCLRILLCRRKSSKFGTNLLFFFFLGLLICEMQGDGYQSFLPSDCLHLRGIQTADGMFKDHRLALHVGGVGDACQIHTSRKGNISPFRNNMMLSLYN